MRNRMMRSLVLALCAVAPVTAKAQELVPHARSQAVGFDIGAFIPSSNTGDQLDSVFYFSTGRNSRKARNLAQNPRCVVCSDNSAEAVIVEGSVDTVTARDTLEPIFAAYEKKYKMDVRSMGEPFYRLSPKVAFGLFEKKFAQSATRWNFPE